MRVVVKCGKEDGKVEIREVSISEISPNEVLLKMEVREAFKVVQKTCFLGGKRW